MPLGAYIHIPFCAYKCHFCDFVTSTRLDELKARYSKVLKQEIKARLQEFSDKETIQTIFYGGGTPGLLETEYLSQIHEMLLDNILLSHDNEISLETNPDTITEEKAKQWRAMGINRLSIGIQSFNDSELDKIGRGHSSAAAIKSLQIASHVGFDNINCDLMYGLPGQNLKDWQNNVDNFVKLADFYPQIKHISAYGLELSSKTPLARIIPPKEGAYPSEKVCAQQYQYLIERLTATGFIQYEISNFAKIGYECRHNLNYWQRGEYHAFGVAAHRFLKPYRSSNLRSLTSYMENCLTDDTYELIDDNLARTETIMLGLRMNRGIDLTKFKQLYELDLFETHKATIKKLIAANFIIHEGNKLKLTFKGQLVANSVISELL